MEVSRAVGAISDADFVLLTLRKAQGAWVSDLYGKTGVMVHSRVAELRTRGHRIECKRFGGEYRYRLVEEKG